MFQKSLIYKRQFSHSGNTPLTISYYLISCPSSQSHRMIYGIQIISCSEHTISHSEEIPHISYSKSDTLNLLRLCYLHLVTPTDLYSSVDLLMNQVS